MVWGACSVALVTTAALYQPGKGDQGPGAPYNAKAKFYQVYSKSTRGEPVTCISHIAYDRVHTSAQDPKCWFPLGQLKQFAADGRIGALAARFHGLPTNRSRETTLKHDCPELLARIRQDHPGKALHGIHGSDFGGMLVRAILDECGWIYPLAVRRRDGVSATAIRAGARDMTSQAVGLVLDQLNDGKAVISVARRRYRNDSGILRAI